MHKASKMVLNKPFNRGHLTFLYKSGGRQLYYFWVSSVLESNFFEGGREDGRGEILLISN